MTLIADVTAANCSQQQATSMSATLVHIHTHIYFYYIYTISFPLSLLCPSTLLYFISTCFCFFQMLLPLTLGVLCLRSNLSLSLTQLHSLYYQVPLYYHYYYCYSYSYLFIMLRFACIATNSPSNWSVVHFIYLFFCRIRYTESQHYCAVSVNCSDYLKCW